MSPSPPVNLVLCEGVTLRYGRRAIAQGLDLSISEGECVQIVGRNGAGKSTLLSLIAMQEQPAAGRIRYSERLANGTFLEWSLTSPNGIGRAWQNSRVFASLTVEESLGLARNAARRRGRDDQEMFEAAVELLGVRPLATKLCDELSLGQARRVALAMTLVSSAPLILLDEPFSGLDQTSAAGLVKAIRIAMANGISFLFSEHFSNERFASEIRQKVVGLSLDGEAYEFGSDGPENVYEELAASHADSRCEVVQQIDARATLRINAPTETPTKHALSVDGLRLARNGHSLEAGGKNGISFAVPDRSLVYLEASNGWGKTSLFRCIAGLERSSGAIRVGGGDVSVMPSWRRRWAGLAYAPSAEIFLPKLSVAESLRLAGSSPALRQFVPDKLINQRVGTLSGGERQLLNLILAASGPAAAVYLLDEPASMLDTRNVQVFKELVLGMMSAGTVLIAVPTGMVGTLRP